MAQPVKEIVAEKVRRIYQIAQELEAEFPGRHFTPDGHMVGSIGEVLAARTYDLELLTASASVHDARTRDGKQVQIKATQINRVALSGCPDWLLVLKIFRDGSFQEVYNGPGKPVWEKCAPMQKNGQRPISLKKLAELQTWVKEEDRLKAVTDGEG